MVRVEVQTTAGAPWLVTESVRFRGHAHYRGEYLEGDVRELFAGVGDAEGFRAVVEDLNGHFAVVLETDDTVFAAVDHIASLPLFYAVEEETVYVGDSPVWIAERLPGETCDGDAATELLMTGYVTGNDTLYPNVEQLRAGQILSVDRDGSEQPSFEQYFRFPESEVVDQTRDRERLFAQFERELTGTFERLVERADGEPLVLALSGGYDSRLVALMLDKLGYENTYAFTFAPDFLTNGDLEVAEQVATELGIDWAPIELTAADFREVARSGELDTVRRTVEDYATAKPLPLWLVVMKKLRDSPAFPDAGIVVTGHDIAGPTKVLPATGDGARDVGVDETVEWILDHHYRLRHLDDEGIRDTMRERVHEWVTDAVDDSLTTPLDAAIRWYWQERTPKFLMRHPDEFAYWGYDRAVPLWDRELASFWSSVPLEHRVGKRLLEEFTAHVSSERIGPTCPIAGEETADGGRTVLSTLETVLSTLPFEQGVRDLYRRWQTRKVGESDEYMRFNYLSTEQFERLYPRVQHEKYFHALDTLSRAGCRPALESPLTDDLGLYERL